MKTMSIKQKARLALTAALALNTTAFAIIGYAASEPLTRVVKPLPVIVERVCTQPNGEGISECTLTYQGGETAKVRLKNGKIMDGEGEKRNAE
jgi:hypothetical protein